MIQEAFTPKSKTVNIAGQQFTLAPFTIGMLADLEAYRERENCGSVGTGIYALFLRLKGAATLDEVREWPFEEVMPLLEEIASELEGKSKRPAAPGTATTPQR